MEKDLMPMKCSECGRVRDGPGGEIKPSLTEVIVQLLKRHRLAFAMTFFLFILLLIAITISMSLAFRPNIILPKDSTPRPKIDDSIVPYISPESDLSIPMKGDKALNVTLSGKLRLIGRKSWLAQPPNDDLDLLSHPVNLVIIAHTASESCNTQTDCIGIIRSIQQFHVETRHWSDIAYNFLVGGDGLAYDGRGWDHVGAHTYGYNRRSIGIAFVGTFTKSLPPDRQLLACKQILEWGVHIGKLSPNYTLMGARQLTSTASPGGVLFDEITKWPHWKEFPPPDPNAPSTTTKATTTTTTTDGNAIEE